MHATRHMHATLVWRPPSAQVAHALELANNYGGWGKVQALLQAVKGVADKHGVMMQTVALRWQIDQVRWGEGQVWGQG